MRNYFARGCATFVLGSFVFGQQPASVSGRTAKAAAQIDLANLLDAKIKAEWEAIKNRDQKAHGEVLTDDYIAVEADGGGERYKSKASSELHQRSVSAHTLSCLQVTSMCSDAAFARSAV